MYREYFRFYEKDPKYVFNQPLLNGQDETQGQFLSGIKLDDKGLNAEHRTVNNTWLVTSTVSAI